MPNLLLYVIVGVAIAALLVLGVLVVRAAVRWIFGSEEGDPRL